MGGPVIGMGERPFHPDYVEHIDGATPDRVRIYYVPELASEDDDGPPCPWQMDGYAIVAGLVAVTSTCWNFSTWAEAIDALPDFIAEVAP
jgi:hypothetical protein